MITKHPSLHCPPIVAAGIACALLLCAGSFAEARTFEWAGHAWTVKEGQANPGNNYWSATTNCVWVDANGYLHLAVKYFSNKWYCAEVYTTNRYPYGEYRFLADSPVTNLHTNIVVGFFLYNDYPYPGTKGPPEIDIEFARQFKDMTPADNSSYAVQPALTPPAEGEERIPTNSYYFFTTNASSDLTTHRFIWTNNQVHFESYTGHGEPGSGSLIAHWTRDECAESQIPQQSMNMGVYLNCYLFQHKEPLGSGDTEIVLRALQMPDPIPPPVMITNVLEDFETAAIVTPPTPTTLYDFENGIAGWGVEWNYNYGFLANSGFPVHSGTNAMRMYNSWDGDSHYKHHITNGTLSITDWRPYNKIAYWARSTDGKATNRIKMVFFEPSGQYWYENVYHTLTNQWQRFEVGLNSTELGTDTTGDPLDLSDIVKFKFEVMTSNSNNNDGSIYMDDVELIEGGITDFTWKATAICAISIQTQDVYRGTYAAEITQENYTCAVWNCIWATNLAIQDWETYNKISYWAKRSTSMSDPLNTGHIVKVQFIQRDGDIWEQRGNFGDEHLTNLVTTDWMRYEIHLNPDDFEHGGSDWVDPPGSPPGNPPDPPGDYNIYTCMTNIYALRFVVRNPWTNSIKYYFDNVELLFEMGPPEIALSLTNTSVGFAPLAPSPEQFRFASSNYASVSYSATDVTYWQLRIFSMEEMDRAGLIGHTYTNESMPLRAWAGTNDAPDPMGSGNWTGQWSFVNDQYGAIWPIADSMAPLPPTFRLYFATEAIGASMQDYSASVVVELSAQ